MDECIQYDRISENYLKTVVDCFGNEVFANPRFTNMDNPWDHWQNMPEYNPFGTKFFAEFEFRFEDAKALEKFKTVSGIDYITDRTTNLWIPKGDRNSYNKTHGYYCEFIPENMPKYPIYIVSKGRWERRPTSDSLCDMRIPHFIVVEESQYHEYLSRVNPEFVTVLILDPKYLENYDTFDDLGATKSKGPELS